MTDILTLFSDAQLLKVFANEKLRLFIVKSGQIINATSIELSDDKYLMKCFDLLKSRQQCQ